MQLVIHLDATAAQQLAEIEQHTKQDRSTILHQAIDLYHQQIQNSDRVQLAQHDARFASLHQRSELDWN